MPDASQIAQDNKARTLRWFEEVWNQGRQETIDELLAENIIGYGLGKEGEGQAGRDYFRTFYHAFRGALPDLKVEVADVLAEGDRTAARLVVSATHTGHGLGMPPTNGKVRVTGMVFLRWQDGQIAEGWNEYDAAGMMRQIQEASGK